MGYRKYVVHVGQSVSVDIFQSVLNQSVAVAFSAVLLADPEQAWFAFSGHTCIAGARTRPELLRNAP